MLKTEELQALLRSAVSQLLTQDVKGTVGLVPMYDRRRFRIHEDELKLIGFPAGINSETASDIFNIGVREICGQIQESASALSEEMLMSACDTVVRELRACDGEHLFVFFVPDIILVVDESIEIGDAMLRKAAVTDTELFEGRANVVAPLSGDAGPLDESDFLKRYLDSALVELRFSGCQFKNELSRPGDAAWKEIRRAVVNRCVK